MPIANHCHNHDEAHSESGTEIGQGNKLILLEKGRKSLVLGKSDNCRIVRKESHYRTKSGYSGKIIKRLHKRTENSLEKLHDSKFRHQF